MLRRTWAATAIAIVVGFLAGCATQPLSQEQLASIRSVGIVWLVPDEIQHELVGFTVFNNERATLPLGDKLAPQVEQIMKERLAQTRPAWRVEPLTYDAATLLQKGRGSSTYFQTARVEADLANLASQKNVDALLVFAPIRWETVDYFGGFGIGVWRRTLLNPVLHANFGLEIVDRNGKSLSRGTSINYANPIQVREENYARKLAPDAQELARLQRELRAHALRNVLSRAEEAGF